MLFFISIQSKLSSWNSELRMIIPTQQKGADNWIFIHVTFDPGLAMSIPANQSSMLDNCFPYYATKYLFEFQVIQAKG